MSSLASVAEQPALLKSSILTQSKNSAGIYGVRFFIRGKPWVISVDSNLLFTSADKLYFAEEGTSG